MRAVWLVLFVPALLGCAVSPNSGSDLELGAVALQARATSDAALSVIQVATAARMATRNTLDDYATREAAEAFRVYATQTREAVESRETVVSKTESAAMGATVQARLATYQAQTPTARAIAFATNEAMLQATATMSAVRPTQTRIAEIAEDAARTRAETIQREQDTAQFRTYLGMVQDIVWAVFPFAVAVVLAVLLGYGLARMMYAGEMFLRTAAANRRVVYNGERPVLYFLPGGAEYEILDPALLPQTYPTLPLPEENRTVDVNRRGVTVDKLPLNLIHGFDERDLAWLFLFLENGGKWTETVMENMPLPHSKEKLGKQQGNTPYARFMDVCTRAEIIVGRGGPGNPSGKLVVRDAHEMMVLARRLEDKT